jgi:acyl-CoA synthetase (AMP-forming)/AMP-acid ligase II
MKLVQHFLEHSAARTPDKIALVCDGQRLSYATLDAMANRLANALRARGVGRGDRVALYLPNSVELVVGIFAILKAGGTFVVVNSTTKHDKLVYMLGNCRASAIIGLARQTQLIAQVMEQVPSLHTAFWSARQPTTATQRQRTVLHLCRNPGTLPGDTAAPGQRSPGSRLSHLYFRQHWRAERGDVGTQQRRLRRVVDYQLPGKHGR